MLEGTNPGPGPASKVLGARQDLPKLWKRDLQNELVGLRNGVFFSSLVSGDILNSILRSVHLFIQAPNL